MIKWIVGGAVGIFLISVLMWWTSTNNKAIDYETQFNARLAERETMFDNMWKTIQQKHQINREYADDFKAIVVANVEGRKGGEMFKAFTEAMPNLDKSIYMDMMATIEGKRDGLKRSQDQLSDIKREHDNLRLKFPSSIVVGGRPEIKYTIVSSTNTKQVIEAGVEDSIRM